MIKADTKTTTLTFDGNPDTVIIHQSTKVTDGDGTRACTTVFTGDNRVYAVDKDGNDIQELTTITTRSTEYTTPESMPAKLPPTSAFTYCVELDVEGVERVRFDKPVTMWVDNFLGFDVGAVVPVGYYDRDNTSDCGKYEGQWIPSDNGVVVKLLDTNNDSFVDAIDSDGNGQPNDLDGDGIYSDEVTGLTDIQRYIAGTTFWRVEINHFTPLDCNWPIASPEDAIDPNPENEPIIDDQGEEEEEMLGCSEINSFVEDRARIFHEDIPIPGTDMTLHYASNRVDGYKIPITIPASGDIVPDSLKRIIVRLEIAGRTFEQTLNPLPNQKVEFVWDMMDYFGNTAHPYNFAHISIGFVYNGYYTLPDDVYQSFAQVGIERTNIPAREGCFKWRKYSSGIYIQQKNNNSIAEGWTLSPHHYINQFGDTKFRLYKGNGMLIFANNIFTDTIAGTGYSDPNDTSIDGYATDLDLVRPRGGVFDSEGNFYFAERCCIRKLDRSGILTRIAGQDHGINCGLEIIPDPSIGDYYTTIHQLLVFYVRFSKYIIVRH